MTKRVSRSRRPARSRRKARASKPLLTSAQRSWIVGLILLSVALLTLLGLLSKERGTLTGLWLDALRRGLGWGVYVVPVGLIVLGVWVITRGTDHPLHLPQNRVLGVLILFIAGLALSHHFAGQVEGGVAVERYGGTMGRWLSRVLSGALSWAGAIVLLVVLVGIGLTLVLNVSLAQVMADFAELVARLVRWLRGLRLPRWKRNNSPAELYTPPLPAFQSLVPSAKAPPAEQQEPAAASLASERAAATAPSTPISSDIPSGTVQWTLPNFGEMLAESEETQMSVADIREKTRVIEETLRSLGVPATVVEVNPGPAVTQFGLEPGYVERRDRDGEMKRAKVKVSRISALANDLALALAASPIRIEAPVPGKGIVGLEIPNSQTAVVGLRGVMESEQFRAISSSNLALAFGRDVSGEAVVDDLGKLPHLLIAGATGSGKSVCINALIACLLCRNTPDELKLLMIDPKRVELSNYNGIPHLLAPVVVEVDRVVGVLNWVTREMDRRYKVFARAGARNIQAYNELVTANGDVKMPFIVVFIDELADLMMIAPEEVERSVCRIAQMARATGIHLVIATQRPSVDVVTGLIKANFPARISFAVSSQIDSRVILDIPGAEKLLGRGDALYMAPDSPKVARIQGCFVSDGELARLVAFWADQVTQRSAARTPATGAAGPQPTTPVVQQPLWPDMRPEKEEADEDPLLREALALVRQEKRASVSFLQRKLRIGYTRAARLIDLLEQKGIVGPSTGTSKLRDVLQPAGDEQAAGTYESAKRETI